MNDKQQSDCNFNTAKIAEAGRYLSPHQTHSFVPLFILTLLMILMLMVLSSCKNVTVDRYSLKHDAAPDFPVDIAAIADIEPKAEPKSRWGNHSPYKVKGKTYYVLPSNKGYKSKGTASWYGKKFHGHRTSNGEVYNMYGMSAAHRSLPIPTYLRVKNVKNGREVIVRVNDRGPFHASRIIDLSYAAALKLGFTKNGTAPVVITAIDPLFYQANKKSHGNYSAIQNSSPSSIVKSDQNRNKNKLLGKTRFLQVAAFVNLQLARELKRKLAKALLLPVVIRSAMSDNSTMHRVRIGPLVDNKDMERLQHLLVSWNLGKPVFVYE